MAFEIDKTKLDKALEKLNKIYKRVPQTNGCLSNISKPIQEGGCGAHCCVFNNPSMLYVEYLNTMKNVFNTWSEQKICGLFEKAIRNFLNNNNLKTCIFFDKEKLNCGCHKNRPLSCQTYGITPELEYNKKYVQLKIRCKNTVQQFMVRQQCNKIKTQNGKIPTTKETDKLFEQIKELEHFIGIKRKDIHDDNHGTYRTYHDHLLIQYFPDNILAQLSHLRLNASQEEKNAVVVNLISVIKQRLLNVK